MNGYACHEVLFDESRKALISVEDTGLGIPEEDRNKIFKPVFTTKSKEQGFGLSVCKRLVEAHSEGSIVFESQVEKGTKFTVKVPVNVRRPFGGND
jgi:signal transduction histidine kinase